MPAPTPELAVPDVAERARRCLARGETDHIGLEVEWIVVDPTDPLRNVDASEVSAAAGTDPLPGGGRITVEPGGQLELSADHRGDVRDAVDLTDADEAELRRRCAAAGLEMHAIGLDPVRQTRRTLDLPRYEAMQAVFDAHGPSAMRLATGTASIQLNIDTGDDPMRVWRLAGLLGPVLVALFANSPVQHGRPTGWASTRQLLWSTVPGGRSRPVSTWSLDEWVARVLDTDVLFIRTDTGAVPGETGFTFRRWVEVGHELGWPTSTDLEEHLTTLFPAVRPRGWVELRMIDTVPADGRRVIATLGATLLGDPTTTADVARACLPIAGRWSVAARLGCAEPDLARSGARCLEIAAETTADADLAATCRDWAARYPHRHRSPADDRLDEWKASSSDRSTTARTRP